MRVRSPALLALSLGLLAAAGGLAGLLRHDGEIGSLPAARLGALQQGDEAVVKGTWTPLGLAVQPVSVAAAYAGTSLNDLPLSNFTYVLDFHPEGGGADPANPTDPADPPAPIVLATDDVPHDAPQAVVAGTVVAVIPAPEGAHPIVILRVAQWREPILFG